MPGANLTRVEAQERSAVVSNPHYAVELDLTVGPKSFISDTTVTFDAKQGANSFLDLIAETVEKITLNGEELDASKVFVDSRIELSGLAEHNTVRVLASCQYSNTGEGLHRSVDPSDGNIYLYSQFEVPDARRVYAVFDQPDLKAVFDFTVEAPQSWEVVSNMPVAKVDNVDRLTQDGTLGEGRQAEGIRRWVFESTPKMSSYLTSFAVGPYARWTSEYANEDGRTVPMALYCRQALKDSMDKDAEYLFDITKKGFAFYANIWGVPYPYAKYDQVFVPEYNAGAMENIGMVTFRDSYIFESKVTDAVANRRVETVLHELAHMWFGDYVTMKWWNDLWLNESFAEFMSTLATAEATEWSGDWATFCSGEKSWALREDQLPTTHPIVAPINDLNDTYVNFDGITYAKGASVLKQLVAYVGREDFFKGIHNYLEKFAYSNATLNDLLAELAAASGRDLNSWSKLWLEQSGINTISADVQTDDEGVITSMTLKQGASKEYPVLRPHRLAVGFYDLNEDGSVVRTERFELDVDGESTQVDAVAGKKRPAFILVNDDDLTYTKIRLDEDSMKFAEENLYRFQDSLARALVWLSFWDVTRDGEYPAERFIGLSLKALSTEKHSTTFRYAIGQLSTAAHTYVAGRRRETVLSFVAQQLWDLALRSEAGSDEQFQLLRSYLGYGVDPDFEDHARGLLSGDLTFEGLTVDNNLRWAIITALASQDLLADGEIDAELAKKDTTENREFAIGAKASIPTDSVKAWAWDAALHDEKLTNSQIEEVAGGFSDNAIPALYVDYVQRYFDSVDWIWKNKSFHVAESLIDPLSGRGLYPRYADPAKLVKAGEQWLESHEDADRALKGMIVKNTEESRRTLKVRSFNEQLA